MMNRCRLGVGIAFGVASWWLSAILPASEVQFEPPPAAPIYAIGQVIAAVDHATERFEATGEYFLPTTSPPGPFRLWLQDAAATNSFTLVGVMGQGNATAGRWTLRLENNGAAPPALGVAHLNELAGRLIEIRDHAGVPYLHAAVPLAAHLSGKPSALGRICLQRPDLETSSPRHGWIELTTAATGQQFQLWAEQMRDTQPDDYFGRLFSAHVETAPGNGVYRCIGTLGYHLSQSLEFWWDLSLADPQSAPPPLGIADIAELTGCRLEVRDDAGVVLLWAVLPELRSGKSAPKWKVSASLAPPSLAPPSPAAGGTLKLTFDPRRGGSTLDLKAKQLDPARQYWLWVETAPGAGAFVRQGALTPASGSTSRRLQLSTQAGDPLPLGANTTLELAGHGLEVRDEADAVHLAGVVPTSTP